MRKGLLAGFALTLVLGFLGAYLFIVTGQMPANADAPPPRWEAWAAKTALNAAIAREAPRTRNPVPLTDENLIAGIRLYGANCAVCHGAADGVASNIAMGLYQRAPQLSTHPVSDDEEGETYWKIAHGIRMTGMPSFRGPMSETQLW